MVYRKRSAVRRSVRRRAVSYASGGRYSKRRPSVRRMRRPAPQKCICPAELSPSAKFVMAQLDTFDAAVSGAKIPDSNTMPSIANVDTDIVNLSSTAVASDIRGLAFRPAYTWGTITSTGGGSVNWGVAYATGAQNRSKRTAYVAAIELYRPVAHAIRISSPLAPTTASGFCHIGLSTESSFNTTTWQFPTTIAQMSGLTHYKRVTIASLTQSPLTVINKWLDDTAFRYLDPNSTVVESAGQPTFQTDHAWGVIVVMIEGAPVSSTVLSFEHILLTEGLPQKDSVIIGTVAAPNSPETLSAVGEMSVTQEPFHTESEQQGYIERGVSAVARGAATQGENIFQRVAIPLLERAGGIAASAAMNMAYMAATGRGGIAGVNNNANRLIVN